MIELAKDIVVISLIAVFGLLMVTILMSIVGCVLKGSIEYFRNPENYRQGKKE